MSKGKAQRPNEPEVTNRRAFHDYFISDTLEVGIMLLGTEVKSVRAGRVSLNEGYVRAETTPHPRLLLFGLHIDEYTSAGRGSLQHRPTRTRVLLAHKREILKLAAKAEAKGFTLIPLKMYFKDGLVKLSVGVGQGKQHHDKREDLKKRTAQRDIQRAMTKRG